jgi:hypothetical protein
MKDVISFKGTNMVVGAFGTWHDYSLRDNFRPRRTVVGWITRLLETANAGFAKVYCTDKRCKSGGQAHEHLICLG